MRMPAPRQFKRAADEAAGPGARWLVLDMLSVTLVDATGLLTAIELAGALRARGVTLALAGRATQWQNWARSRTVCRVPLRRSAEMGEQPSHQRKDGDRSDEDEVGPAADHLHGQVLALQEFAEPRGRVARFFVSLSRHAFHYATEAGRRTGKMQRTNGVHFARQPPSTTRLWPLIYEASGEARKHTAAAMSSTVPRTPTGMSERT
jgi:hypothetical protein